MALDKPQSLWLGEDGPLSGSINEPGAPRRLSLPTGLAVKQKLCEFLVTPKRNISII